MSPPNSAGWRAKQNGTHMLVPYIIIAEIDCDPAQSVLLTFGEPLKISLLDSLWKTNFKEID